VRILNEGEPVEVSDTGITISTGLTEKVEWSEDLHALVYGGRVEIVDESGKPIKLPEKKIEGHAHYYEEILNPPEQSGSKIFHAQDRREKGKHGGTFTAGARRVRELNTVVLNEISGCSLLDDRITLFPGRYCVDILAPCYSVRSAKAWLRNVTTSEDALIGMSHYVSSSNGYSRVSGIITVKEKSEFEILHRAERTKRDYGFGRATDFDIEIYTDIKIREVA